MNYKSKLIQDDGSLITKRKEKKLRRREVYLFNRKLNTSQYKQSILKLKEKEEK